MNARLDIRSVASPALVKRGSVNVIALDVIRRQTGARWEKMRDAIHARLETLLGNKLGPTDFFAALSDTAFLVVTPSFEGDDARLCCFKIAYELHKSLLGVCALGDIALARVDGEGRDSLELKAMSMPELSALAIKSGIEDLCIEVAAAAEPRPRRSIAEPGGAAAPPAYCFTPVWDAPHQALTAYRLGARDGWPTGPSTSREAANKAVKVLIGGIGHAARMLTAGLRAGGRYLTVIPIPFDTLSAPQSRMEIAAACRNLPADLRPFLIFEITDMPAGVPQSRMTDLVCSIRPFGRAVTLHVPPGPCDGIHHRAAGHQGLALQIAPFAAPHGIREDIARLVEAAKRLGMASVVSGVDSAALADYARRSGVNYLSGPFIGADVDVPLPMCRLRWRDLLRRACGRPQHDTSGAYAESRRGSLRNSL